MRNIPRLTHLEKISNSVAEARRDALKILKELESGKDINTIMGKDEKYLYKNLFNTYINQKIKNGISQSYIAKITKQHQNYILPSFGNNKNYKIF